MKAERIMNNLKELEENWMHKTKCERVNGVRTAVVDLNNSIYYDEVSKEESIEVLNKINHLMLFIM